MRVNVTYDGGFSAITEGIEERISEAIAKGAEVVRDNAKSICPVDTGALRNSITVSERGMTAEISAGTDYAAFVEYGTSKMAAQPYLVPSLLGHENEILNAVLSAIKE